MLSHSGSQGWGWSVLAHPKAPPAVAVPGPSCRLPTPRLWPPMLVAIHDHICSSWFLQNGQHFLEPIGSMRKEEGGAASLCCSRAHQWPGCLCCGLLSHTCCSFHTTFHLCSVARGVLVPQPGMDPVPASPPRRKPGRPNH